MHTNSTRNDPSIDESFLAEKLKHHFLSFSLFPLFFFPSTPISSPFSLFFFNFFFSIFPLPLFLVLSFSTRLLSLFLSFFPVAIFCCLIHTKTIVCEKCNTELKKKDIIKCIYQRHESCMRNYVRENFSKKAAKLMFPLLVIYKVYYASLQISCSSFHKVSQYF